MSGTNLTESVEGTVTPGSALAGANKGSTLAGANSGSTLAGANKGELFASFDVDAFEVPGGRDELWRFTPLKRLRGLHDGSAPATGVAPIEVTERPGVTVESVRRGDERLGQGGTPTDRVAAQAFSSFNSATVVTVTRETEVDEPIEIAINGPGEGAVAYGHLQIRVEELAQAIVVVDLRGSGTYADNVEIIVGDSAGLGVIWIADWADDMVHVSAHHARLGKDSVFGHVNVTLGGDVVRTSATVRFTGPGGDAKLLGLLTKTGCAVKLCAGRFPDGLGLFTQFLCGLLVNLRSVAHLFHENLGLVHRVLLHLSAEALGLSLHGSRFSKLTIRVLGEDHGPREHRRRRLFLILVRCRKHRSDVRRAGSVIGRPVSVCVHSHS